MALFAQRAQGVRVFEIGLVVNKSTQVHAVTARKILEQVVRAHLVALGRRVGNTMGEKEQVLHETPS